MYVCVYTIDKKKKKKNPACLPAIKQMREKREDRVFHSIFVVHARAQTYYPGDHATGLDP